jgi:hypothetical protein
MRRITPSANPPYGLTTCSLVRVRTLAGLIGRREDMLIDDAGLANEAGPFQLCFRNKSYDFAHRRLRIFERICEHCEANIVPSLTDSPSVKMRPLAPAATMAGPRIPMVSSPLRFPCATGQGSLVRSTCSGSRRRSQWRNLRPGTSANCRMRQQRSSAHSEIGQDVEVGCWRTKADLALVVSHVRFLADCVAKVVLPKVSKILRAAGAIFV